MTKRIAACSLVLCASLGLLAGCAVDAGSDPLQDEETTRSAEAAVSLAQQACTYARMVGPRTGAVCADRPTPNGVYKATSIGPRSLGWCAYDWTPSAPGNAPSKTDTDRMGGMDPDCNVVGALGGPVSSSPVVEAKLRSKFLEMAGATALPTRADGTDPARVRVAVVDTSPDRDPALTAGRAVAGRSQHGLAVARVIRELSCPGDGRSGVCIGQIDDHLALPQVDEKTVDTGRGGYFGSQVQLARAIVAAVDAWSARRQVAGSTEPPRLVVNLSVGWDPGRGYETAVNPARASTVPAGSLSYTAQAVRRALEHASCKGAIVIAAAGNRSGAGSTVGPMLPAAWEKIEAPGVAACEAMEGGMYFEEKNDAIFPASPVYRPLLWSASGVDAGDRAIGSTRDGGNARLVAYADQVAVSTGGGSVSGYVGPFTGSSMAAAVVSGVAATAWGYDPKLNPAQVMQLVYDAGLDLTTSAPVDVKPRAPSYCFGSTCERMTTRRVSLAIAVARACDTAPGGCGAATKTYVDSYKGDAVKWDVETLEMLAPALKENLFTAAPCGALGCTAATAKVPTQDAMPWVQPQPGKWGCDVCGVRPFGGAIFIPQPSGPIAQPGSTATLTVTSKSGTQTYVMPQMSTSQVTLAGDFTANPITSASMSFYVPATTTQPAFATNEPVILMK